LSGGEQSVSSDEAENISDNIMQPEIWANSGAEQPHFPFSGKPGINVVSEDPSNPLCTPDIAEVTARETNRHAQKFVEDTSNLKLKCRTHHWPGIDSYIIVKYSQYLPFEPQHCFW
jgi:hypothetical protein